MVCVTTALLYGAGNSKRARPEPVSSHDETKPYPCIACGGNQFVGSVCSTPDASFIRPSRTRPAQGAIAYQPQVSGVPRNGTANCRSRHCSDAILAP